MTREDITLGQFIELDGLVGVVVELPCGDLADHVGIWFGEEGQKRISQGGLGNTVPEVWLIPAEYCNPAAKAILRH